MRTVTSKGSVDWKGSRTREPKRSVSDLCELQGMPRDFFAESPFTADAQRRLIANGVPIPMGRAVARAVKKALII